MFSIEKAQSTLYERTDDDEIVQTMNTEISVQGLIQKAYDSLKVSDATSALKVLEEALKIDFEHPEVVYALKCLNWWLDRIKRLPEFADPYERGGFILSQWKSFYSFLDRIGEAYDPCQYALRRFVFSTALQSFQNVLGDGVNQHDPGLLLQVGRCYKGVGNYDLAIKYLEQAARFKREDGETLSELADVNALLNETRAAKVLFREAFFLDPQGIDLRSMESEMIIRLRDWVKELGYEGAELAEWIPIYGCLLGVFSVKRVLKQVELGRLKQSIFTLENELRNQQDTTMLLKPRLINRYFWLIDHYEHVREDSSVIEETMLKIKVIDPGIYERYRN
jgi:tetratricopeptide (TPR) repeat protein